MVQNADGLVDVADLVADRQDIVMAVRTASNETEWHARSKLGAKVVTNNWWARQARACCHSCVGTPR